MFRFRTLYEIAKVGNTECVLHRCSEVVALYVDNVYIIQPGASLFENPTLYFVNSGKIEC